MNTLLAPSPNADRSPAGRAEIDPQARLETAVTPSMSRTELLGNDSRPSHQPHFPALSNLTQLSSLDRISSTQMQQIQTLAAEIQRSGPNGPELAREMIRDLTSPQDVNQGIHATCTMTTLQKQLAAENPLEYARMVRDLAVTGSYTFKDPLGSTVTLDPVALQRDSWNVPPPYEARSTTERMIQNVLMRYAIGDTDQARANGTALLKYDQTTDTISGTYQGKQVSYRGLFEDQVMLAMQGVSGQKADVYHSASSAMPVIERELAAGKSVMVELKWADSGVHQLHALSVDHIDHKTGTVYLFNPHGAKSPPPEKGAIQTISLAEFNEKFACAFVLTNRPNDGKVPPAPPIEVVQQAHQDSGRERGAVIDLQVTPPVAEKSGAIEVETSTRKSPAFTVVPSIPSRDSDKATDSARAEAAQRLPGRALGTAASTLFTSEDDDLRMRAAREKPAVEEKTPPGGKP